MRKTENETGREADRERERGKDTEKGRGLQFSPLNRAHHIWLPWKTNKLSIITDCCLFSLFLLDYSNTTATTVILGGEAVTISDQTPSCISVASGWRSTAQTLSKENMGERDALFFPCCSQWFIIITTVTWRSSSDATLFALTHDCDGCVTTSDTYFRCDSSSILPVHFYCNVKDFSFLSFIFRFILLRTA